MGEVLRPFCPHCNCHDVTKFSRGDSPEPTTARGKKQQVRDRAFLESRKDENLTRVMAMPILGYGSFVWCGEPMRLPVVKLGKRDVTLRDDRDGSLITFKKKDLTKFEEKT